MFNLKVANQIIFEEKDVSLKFMNKILIHIIMGYILVQIRIQIFDHEIKTGNQE